MINLEKSGATRHSALQNQVKKVPADASLVIVELGKNDLLYSLFTERFETNLFKLLETIGQPNRSVIMLELPLPMFANRIGQIQRSLARKHHVSLIPKRHFADVLNAHGAASDSMHLMLAGHQRTADIIGDQLESYLAPTAALGGES